MGNRERERKASRSRFVTSSRRQVHMGARKIFTVGYERSRPEAVLRALKEAKVQILVDTRALASSRKPGFSKRQLSASLDATGIAYLHLQKLGTPAEGRAAARAGRMEAMRRIYGKHLKTHDAVEAMDELLAIVDSGKRVCLLCFERDPAHCHRSIIAGIVRERTGAAVDDLMPEFSPAEP
jgi:uncharacterized protein (DUF488 family)